MSDNKDNISDELESHDNQGANVSGRPEGTDTGPIAGGADNTRGENKPSREGNSGSEKKGKASPDNNDHANLTTTTRGADSSDKEFRNDQPNASTLKGHKSNEGLGNAKD